MQTEPQNAQLTRTYAWFSAVNADDIDLLNDLLVHGFPIDSLHPLRHSTALMEATRRGSIATVQWLLECGAAPALLCGSPSGTALHCAVRRHHWEIAAMIINAMDDCAVMDAYGATPLHALCADSYMNDITNDITALAALLVLKHCPLDALDHEGTTALHHCVVNDQLDLAKLLLRLGANPNARIPDSLVSPLFIAAIEKNNTMAELLMDHGANPELATREGVTPLTIYPELGKRMPAMQTEILAFPSPQERARI